jgi:DNA (cytosine-5)-methyltransferase 1
LNANNPHTKLVKGFVLKTKRPGAKKGLPAISLFSGAGLSDLGYQEAGFKIDVQLELDARRSKVCRDNFPHSSCITGDIRTKANDVIKAYRKSTKTRLALLSITPPCQGMSSSNPERGKASEAVSSDTRNTLLLEAVPIIRALKPRLIVIENVPLLMNRVVKYNGKEDNLFTIFQNLIGSTYAIFSHVVQMADYGVPQDRKRAVVVAIHKNEMSLKFFEQNQILPIPKGTHAKQSTNGYLPWITSKQWFEQMQYPMLDAISKEKSKDDNDILHFVPYYSGDRYLMVKDIPKNSGKSAYSNSYCHFCKSRNIPARRIKCPKCKMILTNRPYVKKDGRYRLIKGFKTSYRRMHPNRPAATITTSSSHIGSNYKIHPWENRVLSARECADIQTIPRYYIWSKLFDDDQKYLTRVVIGEALPPWFTYQHGKLLRSILENEKLDPNDFIVRVSK